MDGERNCERCKATPPANALAAAASDRIARHRMGGEWDGLARRFCSASDGFGGASHRIGIGIGIGGGQLDAWGTQHCIALHCTRQAGRQTGTMHIAAGAFLQELQCKHGRTDDGCIDSTGEGEHSCCIQ